MLWLYAVYQNQMAQLLLRIEKIQLRVRKTKVNIEQFVANYVATASEPNRSNILIANNASLINPTIADEAIAEMKAHADQLQRADSTRAQIAVDAMTQFAKYTDNPLHIAEAYFAKGNLEWVAFGRFAEASEWLNQASEIYEREQQELKLAKLAISKIAVLANLGRFKEALVVGENSQQVLLDHGESHTYAAIIMNMASVCEWMSDLPRMQTLFEEAEGILEVYDDHLFGQLLINKSIILRMGGQFQDSIEAAQRAYQISINAGYMGEAQRARQSLAVTHTLSGRYNESLDILNKVQRFYERDNRQRDAMRVGLYTCEMLLQIHQYDEVITKCSKLRAKAIQRQNEREAALAAMIEAEAYTAQGKYAQSEESLSFAQAIFMKQGNRFAVARTQLQTALIDYHRSDYARSHSTVTNCIQIFGSLNAYYDELSANLLLARVLLAQEKVNSTRQQIKLVLSNADTIGAPVFTCRAYELHGDLALLEKQIPDALSRYNQAIDALEMLKGNLMVEHRIEFAAENQRVYEKAVATALELEEFALALEYAERAKSRALLELLAYRIDLSIEAKDEDDVEIVTELKRLQSARNRIYRELDGSDDLRFTQMDQSEDGWAGYNEIVGYEAQITELWQRLLVRNADYAQDAALLWQWQKVALHEYIDMDTLVVEYFVVADRLVLFLIDNKNVAARYLNISLSEINQLLNFFDLNCASVVESQHDKRLSAQLLDQSQAILQQLYQLLIGPIQNEIVDYKKLLIVPHYSLHHLPFHALYTGSHYLIETHAVHYLPSASLLRFCQPTTGDNEAHNGHGIDEKRPSCATFGYSNNNRLPYSVTEAEQVAEVMHGTAYVNEAATTAALSINAKAVDILHISTHGDFHAENPLFSALTLADGPLTILDIFGLRLKASLVVLSACQTGRNVVSNGDELRGLLRAFLYAGASSLILTHWLIEDQSTAHFMKGFYSQLAGNQKKIDALRNVQLAFINPDYAQHASTALSNTQPACAHADHTYQAAAIAEQVEPARKMNEVDAKDYRHPYWWASFFLVGHADNV